MTYVGTIQNTTTSNSAAEEIGHDNRNGTWFTGSMDDIRVYTRALSAGEIWDLFQGGSSNFSDE